VATSEEREALETAVGILEKARCLETEMEATALMASSLLKYSPANHNEFSANVSDLPGGVRDAWAVVSDASLKQTAMNDAEAASQALAVSAGIIDAAKHDHALPLGRGQLGKAVHTATLSTCLQREANLAQQIQDRRKKEGATLKRAMEVAKSRPNYEAVWLQIFDERLQRIRSYHARHEVREDRILNKRQKLGNPATDGYDLASTMAETVAPLQSGTLFNEEEVMGKYLDLQPIFESFNTLLKPMANVKKEDTFSLPDFLAFLSKGSLSKTIGEADKLKERKKYVRFLNAMQTYLEGFIKRVSPLLKLEEITKSALDDFCKEWKSKGGIDGWESKPAEAAMVGSLSVDGEEPKNNSQGIDLAPYKTAADLEKAVDGDQLKAELARLGLKCGGAPADRAKRLFMTKDTPLDQLPQKLFAKKKTTNGASTEDGSTVVASKSDSRVDIARRETIVMALLDYLRPTVEASLQRLERRQTQTLRERDQELEEELHGSTMDEKSKPTAEGDEDDSDEEDTPIYNPKGVPLGWDGKPIPYWLFKLHGLNHFYPCEICGNESYRGRKNFEMHFTDAKHSYGMKCLGIPNTVRMALLYLSRGIPNIVFLNSCIIFVFSAA